MESSRPVAAVVTAISTNFFLLSLRRGDQPRSCWPWIVAVGDENARKDPSVGEREAMAGRHAHRRVSTTRKNRGNLGDCSWNRFKKRVQSPLRFPGVLARRRAALGAAKERQG